MPVPAGAEVSAAPHYLTPGETLLTVVVMIVISLSGYWGFNSCVKSCEPTPYQIKMRAENERHERQYGDNLGAAAAAQTFVKARLVSPATAKFPWAGGDVTELNPGEYSVKGYVDSQNAFGAMLRKNYLCIITYKDGVYSLIDIHFE